MTIEFHPWVGIDFEEAVAYYEAQSGEYLAERFKREFQASLETIRSEPRRFPFYAAGAVFRRIHMESFPYVIIYRENPDAIRVVMLRHERRHPDFGAGRY